MKYATRSLQVDNTVCPCLCTRHRLATDCLFDLWQPKSLRIKKIASIRPTPRKLDDTVYKESISTLGMRFCPVLPIVSTLYYLFSVVYSQNKTLNLKI